MAGRKLRIAVDARSLLCAQPRGEGKSLLRLYREIAALRPDIEVLLFGDDRAARYAGELPPGARVQVVPALTHRLELWEDLLFPLRARLAGCTLMHAASSSAPRVAGLPLVMTVHDLIPLVFDDGHEPAARQRFERRLGHGVRQARRILAVSHHTEGDLLARFPAAAGRTRVAHWGGDELAPGPGPAPVPPVLLLFGGEARRKNTDYSVDRFIAAARRVPGLTLQVIGISSPPQRQALQARLQAAGLADRVSMPGFVSEDELSALVRRCSALLYLSLYEGFGLPVLEGIGQGLPVIASDRSSIPEILAGVPGLHSLEDPQAIEDTIVQLCTDAQARAAYAQAQHTVLSRFAWRDTAARTITAFEEALCA